MNLEDILGDIDKSFAEKQQQEVYMTYVMVAAAFIAASYFLLWDSAELGYNKTQKKKEEAPAAPPAPPAPPVQCW